MFRGRLFVAIVIASFCHTIYTLPVEPAVCQRDAVTSPVTANRNDLNTWWHVNSDRSLRTAVAPEKVRQSHLYSIQVASSNENKKYYDSFVYAATPRNGNGNVLRPDDPTSTTDQPDGITVEVQLGMSMSWTQFLYADDVTVKISRDNLCGATAGDVQIRPSHLNYKVSDSDGDIYIDVPYSDQGTRFSVEFADNLYDFRSQCSDPSYCYFVDTFSDEDLIIGREPLNSLMIFASPFPSSDNVPDVTAESTLAVEPGLVTDLDKTEAKTVYFGPGIYYLTGSSHANLSSSVNWFHISAGAYVKGAVQFNTESPEIRATGHGVLSGEQYVYQANPSLDYTNYKEDGQSLKMIEGYSYPDIQQSFQLTGITVTSPPFNTFDFTGDLDTVSVHASDYKQVGSFFAQTDGLTVLPNSHLHDIFYHSNDDTIKTYYSHSLVERVTVWKGTTAPVIQFGWASRNMTNITVTDIDVIHARWNSNASHPSIIGGNQVYGSEDSDTSTANLQNTISNVTFRKIRTEGINGGNLFRIVPLSTIKNMTISDVYINAFPPASTGMRESQLPGWWDQYGQMAGVEGFIVKNFTVGINASSGGGGSGSLSLKRPAGSIGDAGAVAAVAVTATAANAKPTLVDFGNDNWGIGELGSLNIATEYLNGDDPVKIVAK